MLTQQRRQHANPKCGKEQADAMPEGDFGWRGLTEVEPNPLRIGYNRSRDGGVRVRQDRSDAQWRAEVPLASLKNGAQEVRTTTTRLLPN